MSEPETMETETVLEPTRRKQPSWLGTHGIEPTNAIEAPWQDIRDAIAAGLSFSKVAKQFSEYHPKGWEGMQHVIRKRSQREGWLVPSTVIAQARERMEARGMDVSRLSKSASESPREPQKTETALVQSLSEMGESGSLITGKLMHGMLLKAADEPHKLAPLVDVKDIAVAAKTLRLVAGMDKQQAPVQFNLWGSPGQSQGQPQPVRDILNIENWSDDE